ncbi:MAG: TIGR02444 family protein [Spongiibacteraceae bacterium]|nr:TIGR02444 family protein [Spongiibacteraceae bacterium]
MSPASGALWEWAVAVYAREAVSARCLQLQDEHGQCVPLLLWAAWAGARRWPLSADTAAAAVALSRAWNDTTVAPLRAIRRRLKHSVPPMSDAPRLAVRERVKALELEAERQLLAELEALVLPAITEQSEQPGDLASSLLAVAAQWSDEVPRAQLLALAAEINGSDSSISGVDNNGI